MAYLGQPPFQEFSSAPTKDNFTGDGSTTTFDLANAVPAGAENALEVFVANVRQEPGIGKAFTLGVDGSGDLKRITFASAPANAAAIYVINDKTNVTTIAPTPTDLNGSELILDANADTSITADTDDRIDLKIGNHEHISFGNSSGDTIIKVMADAKDIKFQQYDGKTLLDIIDGGYIGIANGATGSGELRIYEDTDAGTNYTGFKVGAQSADIDYVLPTADGTSGQLLSTNGSGTLSWAAAGSLGTDAFANDANNRVVTGTGNATLNGEANLTFNGSTLAVTGAVTVSTNLDVDGTANLDAVDIDGAVQLDSTLTIGANDQGYDVILYGDTASANLTWDTSADDLILNGAARIVVPDGQLVLGSTAVSSTAAELNLLDGVSGLVQADFTKLAAVDSTAAELNIVDGNTSATSTTVADADRVVMNDNGTMVQVAVTDLAAYFDDEITAMPNLTSVGTLTALTVDDVAVNGKVITMTGSTSDTATLTVGTNGTLDIVTTDDNAAAANIQITADGTAELAGTTVTLDSSGGITLDADGGTITFADGGSSLGTITSSGYSGTAAAATTVTITDNESTDENNVIVFVAGADADGGTGLGLESDGNLTYNPSSGTLNVPNISVTGTQTIVNSVTMNASNAVVFEGATADAHETTLTSVDATADRTISLPNVSGTLPVLAAASATAITATPTELNYVDGVTSAIQTQLNTITANNWVTNARMADNAIGTNEIANNAVTTAKTYFISTSSVPGVTSYGDGSSDGYIQLNCSQNSHGIKLKGPPHSAGADYTLTFPNNDGSANEMLLTDGSGVLSWSTVGTNTLAADAVTGAKIADDAIDSEHYVDGSIDNAHLAADAVNGAKIADNAIDSEHYVDGSIDTAHIADDQITAAKLSNSMGDCALGVTKIGFDAGDQVEFNNNTDMRFKVNGNEEMRLEADGDLHVDGDVIAFSTTISDERLKDDIVTVDDALNKVEQLRGCTFTFKETGKKSAGVIAQDVEKVLPCAVKSRELPLHGEDDGEEYLTVDYDSLNALLIESIKELSTALQEATKRIETLENR